MKHKLAKALVVARIKDRDKIKPVTWNGRKAGPWDRRPHKAEGGPVTDPSVLSQLNADSGPKPVTDTATLAALNAPDKGVANAVGQGVAQGATGNFYDELRGLIEANGASPHDPASLSGLVKGAYKYWTGDPEAEKKYDEAVKREREESKTVEKQHPVATTVGELGGALALPVGAGATAATLPARMARGAATGAGVGALYGAGQGETPLERATGAGTGAVLGGATGGLAPPLVEGALQGARALAKPAINAYRGATNPEGEAGRRVLTALDRDFQTQGPQFTPQDTAVAKQAGSPTAIIDAGGETTRALARSAANTSPEAREALTGLTQDRFGTQNQRASDFVNQLTGATGDNAGSIEALKDAAQKANRPAYRQAYKEGDQELFSPEMERLMGSPAVVDAMRRATVSGKDRAVTQGFGAFNPGVTVENGMVTFKPKPNGVPTYPNLQFWDATKRELDDAAKSAARSGNTEQAGVTGNLAKSLRNELDNLVPSYSAARSGAAQAFGAQDALEAGANFVNSRMNNAEARRAVQKMSGPEKQLFQHGYSSALINKINETGDRRTILNQIAQSPADRERLEIALGSQKARQLEAFMRVEGLMDRARTSVTGNSTTARQLTELGLAGGATGIAGHGDFTDPKALATGAVVYGLTHGRNKINEAVAKRVGEMLASDDPNVLKRGAELIAKNGQVFNKLRAIDGFGSKSGAGVSASQVAPIVQGAVAARADDKKKQPQRIGQ